MPNSFTQINTSSSTAAQLNQINQNFSKLDAEAVTKKFGKGANQVIVGRTGDGTVGLVVGDITGDAIVYGKYRPDRFGTLYYQDGIPVALDGQAPDDGRMGHWTAKPGQNVLTLLGG